MGYKIASGADIEKRKSYYIFMSFDVGGTFVSDKYNKRPIEAIFSRDMSCGFAITWHTTEILYAPVNIYKVQLYNPVTKVIPLLKHRKAITWRPIPVFYKRGSKNMCQVGFQNVIGNHKSNIHFFNKCSKACSKVCVSRESNTDLLRGRQQC